MIVNKKKTIQKVQLVYIFQLYQSTGLKSFKRKRNTHNQNDVQTEQKCEEKNKILNNTHKMERNDVTTINTTFLRI